MLKRRILVLSGLFFLFLFCFSTAAVAKTYTVRRGDNLYTISKKTGVSIEEIKKINRLTKNNLKPGMVLQLPSPETGKVVASHESGKTKPKPIHSYTIKKGDTLATISQKTGVPIKHIIALNKVNSRNLHVGHNLVLAKASPPVITSASLEEEEEDDIADDDDIVSINPSGERPRDGKTKDELLGTWDSPDERKLFVRVATGFLGAPYRLGGANVRGIDCSGFVRKMYEMFDVSLPRTAREQSMVGVRIDRDKLEAGDLVFFRTKRPIGHVGIYIGNNEFVHASYRSKSVRIDNLDMPYFQKRYLHAVRVKGLDDQSGT
jgi:LysM repeat protein